MNQPTQEELSNVALLFKKSDRHAAHQYQDFYRRKYGYKVWDQAFIDHTKMKKLH